VAVDASVIPLGSRLFIPELVGLPRGDGTAHDGCFVAEDRGLKVLGHTVDVFTGEAGTTALWTSRVPSRHEVHVLLRDPRCNRSRS
jgi:3D (Asp-Asp-Asp) domain-containing protein